MDRGTLTSIPEILINLGILLGYISNYTFSNLPTHISWRVMLFVGILPSVFVAIALFIIPESPRWLVMRGRVEEARSVLRNISQSERDAEERLLEIEEAAKRSALEKEIWRELLCPSPMLQQMLVVGFGIQCFQQITGIDATLYYSPTIISDSGISSKGVLLGVTIAVGFTKTIFILVAIFLVDKVGRKPLLYVSTIGMTVCLFVVGLSLSLLRLEMGYQRIGIALVIVMLCGNVAFFSIGIGPICWVLSSEIFPLRFRAQASAFCSIGGRVCSGLITMSFLTACHFVSVGGVFFAFATSSALSVVFVYVFVPETKGKTLEEIEFMFGKGKEWEGSEWELEDAKHLVGIGREF